VRGIAVTDHRPGAMGILLVKTKPGASLTPPRPENDPPLARWLIERAAWAERTGLEMLRLHPGPEDFARRDRPIDPELLALLRCPDCRAPLAGAPDGVRCAACGARFAAEFGVPILYPTGARGPGAREPELLARLCRDDAGRRRVVRRLMRRLRRNERPPGPLRRLAWRLEDHLRPRA